MRIRGIGAWLALLPAVIAVTAVSCAPQTPVHKTLVVDGQQVSLHFEPSTTARPLVLALHGLGSTGSQFEKDTGLDGFADAHGFVVAYPNAHMASGVPTPEPSPTPTPTDTPTPTPSPTASPTHLPGSSLSQHRALLATTFVEEEPGTSSVSSLRAWDAGYCCGGSTADDVTYLRDVVTAVAAQTKIDLHRVYVVGLSNGGMMALRAICEAPTVFAAAGTVAGPYLGTSCARPVWIHLHDVNDPVVPYYGGVPPGSTFLNVAKNWCLCSFPDSATEQARFSPTTIQVVAVAKGLHTWPRTGDGAWNVNGNALLWSFLSRWHL